MLKIIPVYFFLSFAIGIFFVYILTPPPEIILKFPTPFNAGKVTYKDKANTCYTYKAEAVKCEPDSLPQPILEDFKGRRLPEILSKNIYQVVAPGQP